MRLLLPLVVSLLMLPASVFSQEPAATVPSPAVVPQVSQNQKSKAKTSYLIELVEFRLGEAPTPGLTAEGILNRLNQSTKDNGVQVLQTFHLSAMSGKESVARVMVQTALTIGVQFAMGRGGPGPAIRNLQQTELGTTLTVMAEPSDDKIAVIVSYAASRVQGERPEDGPPDIVSFTLQTQLLVAPGQRVLLGGANGASSSYAALTVTEQ